MPDVTITITTEEVALLESFFEEADEGVKTLVRGQLKQIAHKVIDESTCPYSARKLSNADLRTEIGKLITAGEIPTYEERHPNP